MKKTVLVASIIVLMLSACALPAIPIPNLGFTPATGPTVNLAATADTILQTAVAQTLTAQPTATSVPPTDTPVLAVESSPTASLTSTPDSTATLSTATVTPTAATSTATLAAVNPIIPLPTLTVRLWGTLPPAVPSGDIRLINRSNTQAYISLQVTSNDGRYAVLEYPVVGTIDIKAPVGHYLYVAWVGGRKMVGNFRLHGDEELSITLFRDKVVIQ